MTEDYIKLYQFTGKDIFGLRTFQPFTDEKKDGRIKRLKDCRIIELKDYRNTTLKYYRSKRSKD